MTRAFAGQTAIAMAAWWIVPQAAPRPPAVIAGTAVPTRALIVWRDRR